MDDRLRRARDHEAEVAEAFGGAVTPMSGAGWVSKQDVRTPHELIECKSTTSLSYSVRKAYWSELYRNGLLAGLRSLLNVKLEPRGMRETRLVVMDEEDYLELSRKAGER
jgi:hypothetical protein